MIPIYSWVVAHTVGRELERKCGKCGRKQLVPRKKKNDTVKCQACHAALPPPKRRPR